MSKEIKLVLNVSSKKAKAGQIIDVWVSLNYTVYPVQLAVYNKINSNALLQIASLEIKQQLIKKILEADIEVEYGHRKRAK